MLYTTKHQDSIFLEVFDENGIKIERVTAADPDQGFYIQYIDIDENSVIKSLKTQRFYNKFKLIDKRTGNQILK